MNPKAILAFGLLGLGAIGFSGYQTFGVVSKDEIKVETKAEEIEITQEAHKVETGKYEYREKRDGIEIHEYQSSLGYGYQVFEEELRKDGTYKRSYGKGPEAEARSYDWVKLPEALPATTTTK